MSEYHEYCTGGFSPDDIVISGMSGRFPHCETLEELKEALYTKKLLLTQSDARFKKGACGLPFSSVGTIENVDKFDADFFGFTPAMANNTDPLQRMLLEISYETILDAGYEPRSELKGANIGVYTAVIGMDGIVEGMKNLELNTHVAAGISKCMLANRCSYYFDFRGPSYLVDTACSSSMVALHNAVTDLMDGRVEAALVTSGELDFSPHACSMYMKCEILSPTAEMYPFDKRANGFIRTEGIVGFFLQRASKARRAYATIKGIEHQSAGYVQEGIYYPSYDRQTDLYRKVLKKSGLTSKDIQYVESHGTGTKMGDPIEIKSINEVYCEGRNGPLYVGTVKSNLGHSEGVAGATGALKALLAFETGLIAPNRDFQEPNPNCEAIVKGSIEIVTEPLELKSPYMLVNSFGFGGSLAQVALKRNPIDYSSQPTESLEIPRLVLYSATTEKAVTSFFEYIKHHLPELRDEFFALVNKISFCPTVLKPIRGYALFQEESPVVEIQNALCDSKPQVWFVMTSLGCQWAGMGLEMMKIRPFGDSIRRSADVLKPLGIDLLELMRKDGKNLTSDRSITSAFVTIAAIQIALVDVLSTLEIHPDGLVGHGIGELTCAYADGCCTAEQTLLLAYWRGISMESADLEEGAMADVDMTLMEAQRKCPEGVYPACHNAEDSVTVSGRKEAVEKFVAELQAEGIFARVVDSNGYALHCNHLHLAASSMRVALDKIIPNPKPRTGRWISSSYPKHEWEKEECQLAGSDYFVHNLMSMVRFKEALHMIPEDSVVIEIGPHFILQSIMKRSVGSKATYIGLMKSNYKNNVGFFMETLGKLYGVGLDPKIERLYRPVQFPVPRGTPFISDLIEWDHSVSWWVPKWKPDSSGYLHTLKLESSESYLLDHFIDGKSLFPAVGFVYLAWKALAQKLGRLDDINVVIEDFKIHKATILNPSVPITFSVDILMPSGKFSILEGKSLVASGKVHEIQDPTFSEPSPVIDRESTTFISGPDLYMDLKISGYEYGPAFRSLVEISLDGKKGFVEWNDRWIPFLDSLLLFYMGCLKSADFVLPNGLLSFKICPGILKEFIKKNAGNTVLPVNFNPNTKVCRTMGVEITRLGVDFVQRKNKPDNCILEEYRFLPYVLKKHPSTERVNQTLQDYMIACNTMIDSIQRKFNTNLSRGKFDVKQDREFDFNSYIKDLGKDHVLLSALIRLADTYNTDIACQDVQDISSKFVREMNSDLLNTELINEHSLRYMFDIIAENSFRTPSVLEIQKCNFPVILPKVVQCTEKFIILKFKRRVVCGNESDLDKDVISECNIEFYEQKDLCKVTKEKAQDIVLSAICTSTIEEARQQVKMLSSLIDERGFLLLVHKTCLLPPESFLATLCGHPVATVPSSILEELFFELDLVVASRISNDVCGNMYLLKRRSEATEHKIIDIAQNPNWFEDLKSGFCNESKILWVVSEDFTDSGIIGMINCLRNEPGGEKIRCVYIPNRTKEQSKPPRFSLKDPFYSDIIKKDLVMNVYKDGSWGTFRHSEIEKKLPELEADICHVEVKRAGDLSSVTWLESPISYMDLADDEFVHIYYSALNFKDVMLATGKLNRTSAASGVTNLIGLEFSGRTRSGERVAGATRLSALATGSVCCPETLIRVPDEWSLEEAATVPVVYATCYYALLVRGNLQPGESLLVHSGTGGIGQAAINIALGMDCEVFTTVGNEEKRQYLLEKYPRIHPENIGCSRDTSFETMIMNRTNGRGVNVVLNSLAGDKFYASIRCLGDHGRFLEIGKYDISIDNKMGLKMFERNISFHGVLLEFFSEQKAAPLLKKLIQMIMDGCKKGIVKPIEKRTIFRREEVEDAFRYMSKGKHIGKILVKIRDEEKEKICIPQKLRVPAIPVTYFYSRKVYIIVGGLGGFGIELCKWLLSKGAKSVVLTSRYGARTPYHHFCLKRWKEMGYHVTVSTRNVAIKDEAVNLLRDASAKGPIGGIFNSALVLHDSFLENMNFESFEEVCAPKAEATKHLDSLSRTLCPELDHFVCFSSVCCGRGNAGQSNYGYANSVMDRICEERRAAGLPGLAIQWGIIGDVGVVHRQIGEDAQIAGVSAQRVKSCLEILNISCQLKHPVVCSYVLSDTSKKSDDRGNVLQMLARIFGLKDPSEFNSVRSFSEMGVDSLTGIEVKKLLDTSFNTDLSLQEIQNLKIADVKAMLEKEEVQESKKKQDGLLSTANVILPTAFRQYPDILQPLNSVESNGKTPLFVMDVDSENMNGLRSFARAVGYPVYALVSSKEVPMTNVHSIANCFLQKIREISPNEKLLLAYKSSSVISLDMALQSQGEIKKLVLLDGYSSLQENVFEKGDSNVFCKFVEQHIPSAPQRIKDQLSNASNFDQKLRVLVDLYIKSCKENVNKSELTSIITDHIKKLEILSEYEFKEKLETDLLVIEDSSKLLANDISQVKSQLAGICTGKINIQRVRDVNAFSEESIQSIISAMNLN